MRLTSSFARHFDCMDLRCQGQIVEERAKARVTRVRSAASLNHGLIRTSVWFHTLKYRKIHCLSYSSELLAIITYTSVATAPDPFSIAHGSSLAVVSFQWLAGFPMIRPIRSRVLITHS